MRSTPWSTASEMEKATMLIPRAASAPLTRASVPGLFSKKTASCLHTFIARLHLFRAPKGRGSVDKNLFLILVKKTLRALVPKARVEAVFQGEESPTQVREDEAEVGKTIQRAAKHQARNVDRGVKGAAQIAREVELLHAVRMGQ